MKKIVMLTGLLTIWLATKAEDKIDYDPFRDKDFIDMLLRVSVVIFVIYLITTFLLSIIRLFLDYKLKNKMMDKGASENLVHQLLQPQKKDSRLTAIKWAIIAGGVGLGFMLMFLFPPFGIHSIMIMSFCISLSFLCYAYFVKKTDHSFKPDN